MKGGNHGLYEFEDSPIRGANQIQTGKPLCRAVFYFFGIAMPMVMYSI